MPVETDWGSSMKGSWYLSARQHVLEFVLFNAVFFVATRQLFRKVLAPGSPQDVSFRTFAPPSTPCRGERFMLAATLFSFATAVAHKCVRGSTIFLLQPCHVSAVLLLYVLVAPKTSRLPHIVFNIYLYILWGTITALVFPDLRDYDLFFEIENFFLGELSAGRHRGSGLSFSCADRQMALVFSEI
ncbi:MAG: TMEM164 family-domain-containing protein [Olpidium bornovanus]|uniref:TMEM164 family-domain-containing protein n=1 Tax=Olpidium bornovanus TaxID=278681 RepID=A0A8H8DH76_9FUNG|nr:MAG: TMEM164 family-domain-containing protein [Olpidium bornovanus]